MTIDIKPDSFVKIFYIIWNIYFISTNEEIFFSQDMLYVKKTACCSSSHIHIHRQTFFYYSIHYQFEPILTQTKLLTLYGSANKRITVILFLLKTCSCDSSSFSLLLQSCLQTHDWIRTTTLCASTGFQKSLWSSLNVLMENSLFS